MFTKEEYNKLNELVFRSDYSGYKPTVIEIPNGDKKADTEKKYAHVAPKYFTTDQQRTDLTPFLVKAYNEAVEIAKLINLDEKYWPRIEYGALRVLDYPIGAISNQHKDFDLFTLMMYRDQPDRFLAHEEVPNDTLALMRTINPQLHIGELGEEIGLGPATLHEVLPSETIQHSIVYFVIPDHNSIIPNGEIVRDWLNKRMARTRTEFKAYK